jgi:hypothetical protein
MNFIKTFTTLLLFFIITLVNAQETTDCKCGVLIGNAGNTDRVSTIIYSKVFTTKCEEGTNRLKLNNGTKSQIMVQFFTYLEDNFPTYLEPFKNTSVSSIQVWVIPSDNDFKSKIDNNFGTSHIDYNIKRVDKFNLEPVKPNPNRTEEYLKNFEKMYTYLRKSRK